VKSPGARNEGLGQSFDKETAQFIFAGLSGTDMRHQVAFNCNDGSSRYSGVRHEYRFDLGGFNPDATDLDLIIEASEQLQ
jgi:hypothetical protein